MCRIELFLFLFPDQYTLGAEGTGKYMLFPVSLCANTKAVCEMTISTKTFLGQQVYSLFSSEEGKKRASSPVTSFLILSMNLNILII